MSADDCVARLSSRDRVLRETSRFVSGVQVDSEEVKSGSDRTSRDLVVDKAVGASP